MAGDALGEEACEQTDVGLEAHTLAHLVEVLSAHGPEFRVVPQEIGELAALLDEVDAGEPRHLLVVATRSDDLTQDHPRVVEAQGLVEVAGQ